MCKARRIDSMARRLLDFFLFFCIPTFSRHEDYKSTYISNNTSSWRTDSKKREVPRPDVVFHLIQDQ